MRVIPLELARQLREAGLVWKPEPGDRFVVPDRDLDEVFVLSHMTIEVHRLERAAAGWVVHTTVGEFAAPGAEEAYGRALLGLLTV